MANENLAIEHLHTLDLLVTCADGEGEVHHYIDVVDRDRAQFFRKREDENPDSDEDFIDAFKDTYKLRLSLARDFTLTLNLPTRIPYLPNNGLKNAYISQIRASEICEPFLLLVQPPRTDMQALMGIRPTWRKLLRRITVSFEYYTPHPTLPAYWRITGRKWEKHVAADDADLVFPMSHTRRTAIDFTARFSLHLEPSRRMWNARLAECEEALTPEMLFSLQQAISTAQLFEGEEGKIEGVEEGWKWQMQSRDMAARCYRTACRDGEQVGWEVC